MRARSGEQMLRGEHNKARYPHLADEDLMVLVGEGDADAFAALYKRHDRAVCSLARRLTLNEQDAEDLVQEAYLKVWRSAGSYRAERGGARKWIFCVVRHQNIDLLRSRTLRRRVLHEALGELPHTQRTVLALAHFCELTHAEIADRLCVPLGTVKGRMRLGLEKLRVRPGLGERTLG